MQAFARLLDALSYQPARNAKLRLIDEVVAPGGVGVIDIKDRPMFPANLV